MGYYASTSWSVTFRSPEALQACLEDFCEQGWTFPDADLDAASNILEAFGEETNRYPDDNPLSLEGYTGGKYSGDDRKYDVLAGYADGTVEFDGTESGDGHSLITLKDGRVTYAEGRIVYEPTPGGTAHADYIAALRARDNGSPVPSLLADLLEMHDATSVSLDNWTSARKALAEAFQGTGTPFVLTPNGA